MHRGLTVVASAAVVVVVVPVLAACAAAPLLRTTDVERAVVAGLAEQVGGTFTVVCPSGVPAQAGATFTCQVTDAATGDSITVSVTQTDDQGAFTWQVTAVPGPLSAP